jgi:adenylate cyclase
VKIGIDEGENLAIQYEFDKSSPIDLIGYPIECSSKDDFVNRTKRNICWK